MKKTTKAQSTDPMLKTIQNKRASYKRRFTVFLFTNDDGEVVTSIPVGGEVQFPHNWSGSWELKMADLIVDFSTMKVTIKEAQLPYQYDTGYYPLMYMVER